MNRHRVRCLALLVIAGAVVTPFTPAHAQASRPNAAPPAAADDEALSNSATLRAIRARRPGPDLTEAHVYRRASLFAVAPPEARSFQKHDLVQIVVRESSRIRSEQSLELEKNYSLDGGITAWPDIRLSELLQLQMQAGRRTGLPAVGIEADKEFEGEGEYDRRDEFTARLSAEIIEILPNGNLVLEARTYIKTDDEEATMKVTGICRQDDITAANTILSSQLHDLRIEKEHEGELKEANQKGIIAKVLDAIFAF